MSLLSTAFPAPPFNSRSSPSAPQRASRIEGSLLLDAQRQTAFKVRVSDEIEHHGAAAFARITYLASKLLQTKLACIALQNSAGGVALVSAHGAEEVPELDTLVQLAATQIVATRRPLVIGQLSASERVERRGEGEPQGVFMAGLPLADERGQVRGALVVADHGARQWQAEDAASLNELAELTKGALEVRAVTLALEQTELLYKALIANVPNGAAFLIDERMRFLVADGPKITEVTGRRGEELVGLTVADAFEEPSRTVLKELVQGAFAGQSAEAELQHGDQWFAIHVAPVADVTGEKSLCVAFVYNTTVTKQLEETLRTQALLLWSILENMHEGVVVSDARGEVLLFNNAAAELASGPPGRDAFQGWPNYLTVSEDEASSALLVEETPFHRAQKGERVDQVEVFVRSPREPVGQWLSVSTAPLYGRDGDMQGGICVMRDVTEAKRAEQAIASRSALVHLLSRVSNEVNKAKSSQDAFAVCLALLGEHGGFSLADVFVAAEDGRTMVPANIWWSRGTEAEGFKRQTARLTADPVKSLPGRVLASREACWIEDIWDDPLFLRADEAHKAGLHGAVAFPVWVGEQVVAVMEFFAQEHFVSDAALLSLMTDVGVQLGRIIERERHAAAVQLLSVTDELTGLANRRGFIESASQALALAARSGRRSLLLFADLDGLKRINDSLGHQAGDRAITDAARALRGCFRTGDLIARLGGDEFVVLADVDGVDTQQVLDRLTASVARINEEPARPFQLAMSVGIIVHEPSSDEHIELLLARADALMYEQKQSRRRRSA